MSALKIADLVWKYSLSRAAASGERTSTISSLRARPTLISAGVVRRAVISRGGGGGATCGRAGATVWAPGVLPPKVCRLPNIRHASW
jgi:hypothetical protein